MYGPLHISMREQLHQQFHEIGRLSLTTGKYLTILSNLPNSS